MSKLVQMNTITNGYIINIGLINDIGYLSINDNNLYPDNHSNYKRKELGYDNLMVPLMNRKQLKELKNILKEVLKKSK